MTESLYESRKDSASAEHLLFQVQKPARYIGNEVNAVRKDPARVKLRMALAFPDVYEIGQSHLGLKILYAIVNARPDLAAERVFAAWPDMEHALRQHHQPLCTLESGTPLYEMDFVGFSLQYELCATTVLQVLELGGIPLRAAQRGDSDPLVVGGGPGTFNPVPLAPFFDAFLIGDGEEAILELADAQVQWKAQHLPRQELLAAWQRIPGVYVPSLHRSGEKVHRRIIADLGAAQFPSRPVVPFCEIVHDRVGIEIARGCTRGCRFCQAGMLYRPVRERLPGRVKELARESVAASGWDEVSLLSLSTGDYSGIGELIGQMTHDLGPERVALSLPSLRTDTFSGEIAEQIRKVRKTGFTLAPEAGTDTLRRVINKGNTEEDLERAVSSAFEQGWRLLKLYFMIGLPLEADGDLDGIVGLIRKASQWAKRGKITASVSTFVPKPHTPFQWARQIPIPEIERRQKYIGRYFRTGSARVKFHSPYVSFLEGVLARGDGMLSDVIERVFRKGARFDGWDDQLRFRLWMEAFEEAGVAPERYLEPREIGAALPWDFVDSGLRPDFLVEEWHKAVRGELTPDCRFGDCLGCGVCNFDDVFPRLAEPIRAVVQPLETVSGAAEQPEIRRFRLCYGKTGPMRFLGHQDLIRLFHRSFRRAGISLDYSHGFHPHPRLRFSPPLALGLESLAEYLEFDVVDSSGDPREILRTLSNFLPEGIQPLNFSEISLNDPSISGKIQSFTYELELDGSVSFEEVCEKARAFHSAQRVEITRTKKGKQLCRDLKEFVEDLTVYESGVRLTVKSGQSGSVHPLEAFSALLGIPRDRLNAMRMVKTSVGFRT
ncbi:MAG: TIGR03960 family B12-binding radical SAM protein [Desulfomonile tiedjei]|nr:TIGR03960 family B12-binding radical SAM protein [Desulfomonile tiedjei]